MARFLWKMQETWNLQTKNVYKEPANKKSSVFLKK